MSIKSFKLVVGASVIVLILSVLILKIDKDSSKEYKEDKVEYLNKVEDTEKYEDNTVGKLKSLYGYTESPIESLYNTEDSVEVYFHFNSIDIDNDAVSVYTNSICTEESKIETFVWNKKNKEKGGTDFIIYPKRAVMYSEDMSNSVIDGWGYCSKLYVKIKLNTESENIEEANNGKGMIIPLTINRDIDTPTLNYLIDNKGQLRLKWEKVDGATGYKIYKIIEDEENKDNYSKYYPVLVDSTDGETINWCDWELDKTNGIQVVSGRVYKQNKGVLGTYFVTAIKSDGSSATIESNFSNGVSTSNIESKIHCKLNNVQDMKLEYSKKSELPSSVQVLNNDSTLSELKINYSLVGSSSTETSSLYEYSIEETMITGVTRVLNTHKRSIANYVESYSVIESSNTLNIESIAYEKEKCTNYNEYMKLKDKYRDKVEVLNKLGVIIGDSGVYDTPYEEYVAYTVHAGNSSIDCSPFLELQNVSSMGIILSRIASMNNIQKVTFRYDFKNKSVVVGEEGD